MSRIIAQLGKYSIKSLTELHKEVGALLATRLMEEKRKLEDQLAEFKGSRSRKPAATAGLKKRRKTEAKRSHPPVRAKYRNPEKRSETWAGRGKQPRWLVAQLGLERD